MNKDAETTQGEPIEESPSVDKEKEDEEEILAPLSTDDAMLILDQNMHRFNKDHAVIREKVMGAVKQLEFNASDPEKLQAQTAFINSAMSVIEAPVKMANTATKTKSQVDVNTDLSANAKDIAVFIREVHSSDESFTFNQHDIEDAIEENFDGYIGEDELREDPTDVS